MVSGLSCTPRKVVVKAMVAVAMMEVGFVLLRLKRGNIGGEREARWYGFMPIKCIVAGPKVQENSGTSEMVWENKIRLRKR